MNKCILHLLATIFVPIRTLETALNVNIIKFPMAPEHILRFLKVSEHYW